MQNAAATDHQMSKFTGFASFRTCSGLSVLFSSHIMSAPPLYSALFAVIESSLEHELLYILVMKSKYILLPLLYNCVDSARHLSMFQRARWNTVAALCGYIIEIVINALRSFLFIVRSVVTFGVQM